MPPAAIQVFKTTWQA